MSYIGNQPSIQAFVTDQFSGNGSTTVFTMSVAPATASSVLVAISGVLQDPSAYSVVGTTLTFSAAPPAGTGNISARYLGIPASNIVTTAYRTVTEFTATASQTTFLPPSYTPGFISVYQNGSMLGSADYTATNGTTVVLAVAATVGDLVTVESFYVSSVANAIPAIPGSIGSTYLANGSATKAFLDYASGTGTGALTVPTGTTAQRPSAPAVGDSRWNTSLACYEIWNGLSWQIIASTVYSVDYLVVAGGGGGGSGNAASSGTGGGGAGGFLTSSGISVSPGTAYTVTVGAGGAGGVSSSPNAASSGSNSSFSTIATSIGGGGGSSAYNPTVAGGAALSGGSGGGGCYYFPSPGSGTSGQGYAGGTGSLSSPNYGGGGGGGASAVGVTGTSTVAGNGGAGLASSISGTSVTYAGGGGAGSYNGGTTGTGGAGGGGNGGTNTGGTGNSGTANTGGGGGGAGVSSGTGYNGGAGGSGVIIIRYAGTSARATGGTITITGGYVIHTFTSSGTFTA